MVFEFDTKDLESARLVCDAALKAAGVTALPHVNKILARLSQPVPIENYDIPEKEPSQDADRH